MKKVSQYQKLKLTLKHSKWAMKSDETKNLWIEIISSFKLRSFRGYPQNKLWLSTYSFDYSEIFETIIYKNQGTFFSAIREIKKKTGCPQTIFVGYPASRLGLNWLTGEQLDQPYNFRPHVDLDGIEHTFFKN